MQKTPYLGPIIAALALCFATGIAECRASAETNKVGLLSPPETPPERTTARPEFDQPPIPGFWKDYQERLWTQGDRIAFGRLKSPASSIRLLQRLERDRFDRDEYNASLGTGLFADALGDSLLDALAERIFPQEWEDSENTVIRFLVGLAEGSIGRTDLARNEAIAASPLYDADALESSWFRNIRKEGIVSYGIRSRPYAYITLALWETDGKRAIFDTRFIPSSNLRSLDDMRIVWWLKVPLMGPLSAAGGFSLYPLEISSGGGYSQSLRLEWKMKSLVAYVGGSAKQDGRRDEKRLEAGLTLLRWK